MKTITINDAAMKFIKDNGSSVWTKKDMAHLYLNGAAAALIGLKVYYYNTGNVSSATLNGEKISNSKALELLAGLDGAYIDLATSRFVGTPDAVDLITAGLQKFA